MLAKRRYWYTNKIRNPRGEGGTVGVIGSGGALPTNWGQFSVAGLSWAFLGTGTEDGLPYSDVRFVGTATGSAQIGFEAVTNCAGVVGNAFGMDVHVKLLAGTSPSVTEYGKMYTAASAYISDRSFAASTVPSSTRTQISGKQILQDATVSYVRPYLLIGTLDTVAYDFSLRIYAPKLVRLAVIEGPEGISNSGPFVNTTGWAQGDPQSILSAASGNLKIENGDASAAYAVATVATVVGAAYKVSYNKAVGASAGRVLVRDGGGTVFDTGSSVAGAGVAYFVARQTSTEIVLTNGSDATLAYFSAWSLASAKLVTPGYMPAFPILPPVGVPGDSSALLS